MPHKKPSNTQPAEDPALIERVDAMMDIAYKPKPVSVTPTKATTPLTPEALPPADPGAIDIFKDMKTKPPLTIVTPTAAVPAPAAPTTTPSEDQPTAETATAKPVATPQAPAQQASAPTTVNDVPVDLEAPALDSAVDEIVVAESDALLAAEDIAATVAQRKPTAPAHSSGLGARLKRFFR